MKIARPTSAPTNRQTQPGPPSATARIWAGRSITPGSEAMPQGCSEAALRLAEADLARSGLSLDQLRNDGVFAVDNAQAVHPDFAPSRALIFPYHDAAGRPLTFKHDGQPMLFCRARYLTPPGFPLPKGRKYDQPAHSGTPPYFPRSINWSRLENGEIDSICITEGEKKAAALCAVGIPTVALGGVFNFADGAAPLHPALGALPDHCHHIYILFDSDAAQKPDIQSAEWRLAGHLALLGKTVHRVRIPSDGDLKVGADDFLVQHGRAALEELILDTPALGDAATTSKGDEITVADILKRKVEPVEELIPGWLEKGITNFLAGPGGVHKSRLAMQWGLTVNAGASVWGIAPELGGLRAPKATLVYCAAEDDANELARRAQAICATLKLKSPDSGVFIPRKGKESALVLMHESAEVEVQPFHHELMALLRGIPGHKLVVLDSAYDFVRFVGRAKIDEDAVNFFIKVVLQGICDQTDSTLLIPWHPSQAGSERESMDGWSVAWHNAARARLGLSAVKDVEDTYELKVTKRNHGRKTPPIQIRYVEGALLPLDALADDERAGALRKLCVEWAITAAGHGIPINRARSLPVALFRDAAAVVGRRPNKLELKDILDSAVRDGQLIYMPASRHRIAGYYPPDPVAAQQLANAAKKAARSNSDAL